MNIELTHEQQQAFDPQLKQPLHIVDPRTNAVYVAIPVELYDRVKELLEDDADRALQKAWLEAATKTRRQWVQENPY